MSSVDLGSPIYEQLVREHGDLVAEARALAEQAHLRAREVLDWRRRLPGRDGRI